MMSQATFNSMVLGSAFLVSVAILFSVKPSQLFESPVPLVLIGFLLSLVGWATILGIQLVERGYADLAIPQDRLIVSGAAMGLGLVVAYTKGRLPQAVFLVALAIMTGIVALFGAIGLSNLTDVYVAAQIEEYVGVSMLVSFLLIVFAHQFRR